jgi:DNA-binding PadR family transcriptional regulator
MTRKDPESQLPLTPVVLHILLVVAEGERYGYAIAEEIEQATQGRIRVGPGTMYGSIQRMLAASLLEEASRRSNESEGPSRRYYKITTFGRRVLELELDRLVSVVRLATHKRLLRPGLA